jgi:hypothetical protein
VKYRCLRMTSDQLIPTLVQQGIYDLNFHCLVLFCNTEKPFAIRNEDLSVCDSGLDRPYCGQKIAISEVRFDN